MHRGSPDALSFTGQTPVELPARGRQRIWTFDQSVLSTVRWSSFGDSPSSLAKSIWAQQGARKSNFIPSKDKTQDQNGSTIEPSRTTDQRAATATAPPLASQLGP